jgi:biopolymer transport protein ExbD
VNKPDINVTPLIDVLLVLLIIFMVVAPLKPTGFEARIPSEPNGDDLGKVHPDTLAVIIGSDHSVTLNKESGLGTVDDPAQLVARLKEVFAQRAANHNVAADRAERTVFIKAPRSIHYGSVARIVDAVKLAGAFPISLQIDHLES